ncbi:hypothetical protein DICVIV_14253 [Dictyocaulus viviparus]|uniref:SCP domain-containing protein n=1 Tax=Dictyocaulus viviparus TaxID=29172 RepID=A0A0D8XBL0_DICVI|nr:hypothetical protein DICVIV_14253 [Dictyocaulus viviparus]
MIPFLQMINDRSNRIGCSYTLCDLPTHYPFVSFVCKYGDPLIQPGVPVYTKGRPCSLCENKCVDGGLCNYLGI